VKNFPVSFSNYLPHLTHPTMTDLPKRSAVTNREATDKLLDNKKRRSSAQVQHEKQTAATAAAAAEVKKANLATQKKQCVAAFEDQLRKEDQQREKNMARPDLVPVHYALTALSHSLIISLSSNPHADQPIGKTDHKATEHPS
jgi:hypothetical protein